MTRRPARWIFGGCNLPTEGGRLRRPWPFALLRVVATSISIKPVLTEGMWTASLEDVREIERIRFPVGSGVRFHVFDDEHWYLYSYESAGLVRELTGFGLVANPDVAHLRYADLPR